MTDLPLDPTDQHGDPGGPVEIRTPETLQAMYAEGYRLNVPDGTAVPPEMRFLLRDDVKAKWQAEFHKTANAHAVAAWYESGADGQIDWSADDAVEQAVKVATPYFDTPAAAAAFVETLTPPALT